MTGARARLIRELAAVAHEVLDRTDAVALHHFESDVATTRKPDRTLVTLADTEIERMIRDQISTRYPDHGLLGEEFGAHAADAEVAWIIDPIDATHNFVRGIGIFATLLACRIGDQMVVGVVSAPAMEERWWAAAGEGAWRRNAEGERRIGVSSVSRLDESHLLYGDINALGGRLAGAATRVWRSRGFGDFWGHVLVSQGSAEAMVEDGVSPWDMAAPFAIISEAGGRMTDLDGHEGWTGRQIVTSNGRIHDELLSALRP